MADTSLSGTSNSFRRGAVLVVDQQPKWRTSFCQEFSRLGITALDTDRFDDVPQLIERHRPALIVCPDDLHRPWLDVLKHLGSIGHQAHVIIVTEYGSISSAVRAIKSGAAAYFAKPVTARHILEFLEFGSNPPTSDDKANCTYLSLGRARWEYINTTLDVAGSIAAAARRLGIARRSLRRMLTKYPPAR